MCEVLQNLQTARAFPGGLKVIFGLQRTVSEHALNLSSKVTANTRELTDLSGVTLRGSW